MAQLTDMDITHVSLVDKGANQRRFAVKKQAGAVPEMRLQKAIANGIAKGSGRKTGVLAALRKAVSPRRRITKSASDLVSQAGWALYYLLDLIEDEAADTSSDPTDPDAAEDQSDVDTLRQAAQLVITYMGATAQEVGTPDDLEDVAEEAAAYAAAMQSYYPVYMRDGGIAKVGQKQFSQARMTRLKEAADTFASVLDEIETEQSKADDEDSKDTKKRAQPEEVNVTSDEIAAVSKAVTEALEPRFAAIEKRLPAEDTQPVAKTAAQDGDITLADVAKAITQVADRVEAIEKGRGERTSVAGQDPTGPVKKSDKFAGFLTGA